MPKPRGSNPIRIQDFLCAKLYNALRKIKSMYSPTFEQAFNDRRAEATADKWLRNIMILGTTAGTAALNIAKASELTWTEHTSISAAGITFAAGAAWMLERDRRRAIRDSYVHASFAVIDARLSGESDPEWAIGNTGNLLDPSYQTAPRQT